jgi:cellulose synthase operon protein YhjQ
MAVVVISSPKGGAGKTTLTANLALVMRLRGWRVTAIDFDSQNALRFHLAPDAGETDGLARAACEGRSWRTVRVATRSGVELIPFGPSSAAERARLDEVLTTRQLRQILAGLERGPGEMILVDTAPGEGVLQARLEKLADLGLAVFLADGASMALLPGYQDGALLRAPRPRERPRFGVLNLVDRRRRLSRDIAEFVDERCSQRFMATVRYDETVAEAAACGCTALEMGEEEAGAIGDLLLLGARLDDLVRGVCAA